MRIDRLDLLSYGHLREQTLDLSRPTCGLTVVVGPNEAGKSTTMRAITALMFGIERGSPDHYGMGRESLRIGASVRDGGGPAIEIVRRGLARAPLISADGEQLDEAMLVAMIGGVERALFKALFCIDHDELHDHSADLLDPDAEIGRLVFGASLGATALTRILKALQTKADGLFRPNGSNQLVAKSLSRARDLTKQARQIRVRSKEWEESDRRLEELGVEATRLRDESVGLRGQESRLQRLISALPLVARRSGLRDEIRELERAGVVQSVDWAESVQVAQRRLEDAAAEQQRSLAARDGVQGRLDALPVVSPLLVAAERIDLLLEGIGRFRKDRLDLPGLEGQLAVSRETLAGLLERLGVGEAAARAVTDAQLATVEELAQARAALDERLASAREELDALVEGIDRETRVLHELPEASEVGELEKVANVARPFVERERHLGSERAEIQGLAGDAGATSERLGLQSGDFEALERLSTPALSALRSHREKRAGLTSRETNLERQVADLDEEEFDLNERREEIVSDSSVPDPEDVPAARARRDEGWNLVRAALVTSDVDAARVKSWAGDQPLEDAFEGSIHEADDHEDARFGHATQLANLSQIDAELAELVEKRRVCEAEQLEIEEAASRLDDEWRALWKPVGVCPETVDAGEEWMAAFGDVQRVLAEHRRRTIALGEVAAQVEAHRSAVVDAMTGAGVKKKAGSLALGIEQADDVVAEARRATDARSAALHAVEQGEAGKPRRELAVRSAEKALSEWQNQWAVALDALGLPSKAGLAAGRQTLSLLREFRTEHLKAEGLRGRVEGLRADIDKYAADVADVAREVAPQLAELDADRTLSELKPGLDSARKESRVREELSSQIESAQQHVVDADEEVLQATGDAARLRTQAGLGSEASLTLETERAERHAELREGVRDLEETLVAQGGGLTVRELLEALEAPGIGEGELEAQRDALAIDVERVEERVVDVNRQYGDAQATMASLDHGGRAAELDQDAELEFAALAEHVSEYSRVALAGEVLRRVVADYGQRNQGPILSLAGQNFSTLTDEAFDGLVVDLEGDKQLLLAKRRNGEMLRLGELSEGTVDQLYLALRLAGVQHHLSRGAKNPPVILDDLLVNFDDERAAAALRLCAELGQQAQVLLFTHHRHIGELATKVLPPHQVHVSQLSARDHSAPVVAPERPLARGRTRASASAGDGEANEAAILEVLAGFQAPLGKSEILQRAGLPDSAWTAAIRALVDRGVVVQEGAKRGAKYHLGGGSRAQE